MKKYAIKNMQVASDPPYHPASNSGWLVPIESAMLFDTEKEARDFMANMRITYWARYGVECIDHADCNDMEFTKEGKLI